MRPIHTTATAALALTMVLGACSGGGDKEAEDSLASTNSTQFPDFPGSSLPDVNTGTGLTIPPPATVSPGGTVGIPEPPTTTIPGQTTVGTGTGPNDSGLLYTIASGDNLSRIARRFDIEKDDLMALNGVDDSTLLIVGHTLKLPLKRGVTGAAAVPIAISGTYTIESGDNYSKIAAKVGVTVAALTAANPGQDPNKLIVGHKLNIPAGGAAPVATTTAPTTSTVPTTVPSDTTAPTTAAPTDTTVA